MTAGLSRRRLRRQQHAELNRNQLLGAAEEVFGAKGFHDTTLKEVADLAEFSVGSVYSFFPSKDELFLQVFLRRGAQLLPAMEAVVGSDEPPLDQLRSLVDLEVGSSRPPPLRPHVPAVGAVLVAAADARLRRVQGQLRAGHGAAGRVFARGQQSGAAPRRPVRAGPHAQRHRGDVPAARPGHRVRRRSPRRGMDIGDLHEIVVGAFAVGQRR